MFWNLKAVLIRLPLARQLIGDCVIVKVVDGQEISKGTVFHAHEILIHSGYLGMCPAILAILASHQLNGAVLANVAVVACRQDWLDGTSL